MTNVKQSFRSRIEGKRIYPFPSTVLGTETLCLTPLTFTRIRIDDTDAQESEEGWRERCRHDFPCRA